MNAGGVFGRELSSSKGGHAGATAETVGEEEGVGLSMGGGRVQRSKFNNSDDNARSIP